MNWRIQLSRLQIIIVSMILILLSTTIIKADTITLVPFGSSGIKYFCYAEDHSSVDSNYPEIFETEYDDSDWSTGVMPFGSSGEFWSFEGGYCETSVNTNWGYPDYTIVARIYFDLPAVFNNVTIGAIHPSGVYFKANGIGLGSNEGCFHCPPGCLATKNPGNQYFHPGTNVVVVMAQAKYTHWVHYLDIQISADIETTDTGENSWGVIKSIIYE